MANSSPPSRATRSVPRAPGAQPVGDFDEHAVAGLVSERVVDLLEPVEVEEEKGELLARPDAVHHRVDEVVAVREVGERVVLRPVAEEVLRLLALGDVADVADDAANAGLVEQVGPEALDPDVVAVGVGDAELDQVTAAVAVHGAGEALDDEVDVVGVEQVAHLRTDGVAGVAEEPSGGGGGVLHDPGGVEDDDEVRGVQHERAPALLARPQRRFGAAEPSGDGRAGLPDEDADGHGVEQRRQRGGIEAIGRRQRHHVREDEHRSEPQRVPGRVGQAEPHEHHEEEQPVPEAVGVGQPVVGGDERERDRQLDEEVGVASPPFPGEEPEDDAGGDGQGAHAEEPHPIRARGAGNAVDDITRAPQSTNSTLARREPAMALIGSPTRSTIHVVARLPAVRIR